MAGYVEPVPELRCPTCGQMLPLIKEAKVDLESNTLLIDHSAIHLQPKQAEVLYTLLRWMPNFVRRDRLVQQVWGFEGPDRPDNSLSVHIANIRKLIRPFGYKIMVRYGGGLRVIYGSKTNDRL